jgi:hypothetical protein
MNRILTLAAAVFVACSVAACSDDTPSSPSTGTAPKFTATLSPLSENPPIVAPNADANGGGTVAITLNVTRDSSQQITAATGDFTVTLQGFPAGTSLTGAHIHQARPGINGGIVVSLGLASGDIVLANGSGTFTRNSVAVDPVVAQNLLNDTVGFYFNVHTTVNTGGATRGQLTAQ